jgi:hypothetical protein
MIWFFTPFAHDKKFLDAIDRHFNLIANPNDWVVIMDGDTSFLRPDFGDVVKRYTDLFPDTGLLTCYASRCHYQCQVPAGVDMYNPSILYHKSISNVQAELFKNKVVELDRRIAGHLMVIRKSTWTLIRAEVYRTATAKLILGVDTKISNAILKSGLKIRLMKELYLLHYLRMEEGFDFKKHLEP